MDEEVTFSSDGNSRKSKTYKGPNLCVNPNLTESDCFECKKALSSNNKDNISCTFQGCIKRYHKSCMAKKQALYTYNKVSSSSKKDENDGEINKWHCPRHICSISLASTTSIYNGDDERDLKRSDYWCALCPCGYNAANLPSSFSKVDSSPIGMCATCISELAASPNCKDPRDEDARNKQHDRSLLSKYWEKINSASRFKNVTLNSTTIQDDLNNKTLITQRIWNRDDIISTQNIIRRKNENNDHDNDNKITRFDAFLDERLISSLHDDSESPSTNKDEKIYKNVDDNKLAASTIIATDVNGRNNKLDNTFIRHYDTVKKNPITVTAATAENLQKVFLRPHLMPFLQRMFSNIAPLLRHCTVLVNPLISSQRNCSSDSPKNHLERSDCLKQKYRSGELELARIIDCRTIHRRQAVFSFQNLILIVRTRQGELLELAGEGLNVNFSHENYNGRHENCRERSKEASQNIKNNQRDATKKNADADRKNKRKDSEGENNNGSCLGLDSQYPDAADDVVDIPNYNMFAELASQEEKYVLDENIKKGINIMMENDGNSQSSLKCETRTEPQVLQALKLIQGKRSNAVDLSWCLDESELYEKVRILERAEQLFQELECKKLTKGTMKKEKKSQGCLRRKFKRGGKTDKRQEKCLEKSLCTESPYRGKEDEHEIDIEGKRPRSKTNDDNQRDSNWESQIKKSKIDNICDKDTNNDMNRNIEKVWPEMETQQKLNLCHAMSMQPNRSMPFPQHIIASMNKTTNHNTNNDYNGMQSNNNNNNNNNNSETPQFVPDASPPPFQVYRNHLNINANNSLDLHHPTIDNTGSGFHGSRVNSIGNNAFLIQSGLYSLMLTQLQLKAQAHFNEQIMRRQLQAMCFMRNNNSSISKGDKIEATNNTNNININSNAQFTLPYAFNNPMHPFYVRDRSSNSIGYQNRPSNVYQYGQELVREKSNTSS